MSKIFLYDLRVGFILEFVMICINGFIILFEYKNFGCGSEGNIFFNNYCEEINFIFVYFIDMYCNELNKTMKFFNVDVLFVCICKKGIMMLFL